LEFASALQAKTGKGYVSASSLKYAVPSSKDFDMMAWELNMKGELVKTGKHFTFGGLYDMLLLEPDNVWSKYAVLDDDELCKEIGGKNPRATKRYKEWAAEQGKDKEIISWAEYNTAKVMVKRLNNSEVADYNTGEMVKLSQYIKGEPQKEFNSWIGDVPVRGFLDVLGDGFITDVKTTRSMKAFKYDVFDLNYDLQAYIYCKVFNITEFYWLAQVKDKPYTCALIKASEETLQRGEKKFLEAVTNIEQWLITEPKGTETFALQYTL
tara:strand:+ start:1426 stop:2226 length:801 start_codon:yes stop_codon:yes gene_type:complete